MGTPAYVTLAQDAEWSSRVLASSKQVPDPSRALDLASCFAPRGPPLEMQARVLFGYPAFLRHVGLFFGRQTSVAHALASPFCASSYVVEVSSASRAIAARTYPAVWRVKSAGAYMTCPWDNFFRYHHWLVQGVCGVSARLGSVFRFAEGPSRVRAGLNQVPDPSRAPRHASCFCLYIPHHTSRTMNPALCTYVPHLREKRRKRPRSRSTQ